MLKVFFFIIKLVLIPVFIVVLVFALKVLLHGMIAGLPISLFGLIGHPFFLAVVSVILLRLLLGYLSRQWRFSNPLDFLDTLEHELTHAIFGYLTLSPPVSLFATLERGGEVRLKRSNVLVALAPYGFPLWASMALGMGFLVKGSLQPVWNLVPFALFGNFLYRLGTEFRWYQEDLKMYGRIFSTAGSGVWLLGSFTIMMHLTGTMDWGWVREVFTEVRNLIILSTAAD